MSNQVEYGIRINISGNREAAAAIDQIGDAHDRLDASAQGAAGALQGVQTQQRTTTSTMGAATTATRAAAAAADQLTQADVRLESAAQRASQAQASQTTRTGALQAAQQSLSNTVGSQAAQLNNLAGGHRAVEQATRNGANTNRQAAMSQAQLNNAMRQVPAQMTDIIVSLQGGMNPMTVLLQQGGQLRDMFGSMSGAGRALGAQVLAMVNPFTVAAAAAAALFLAHSAGSAEARAYTEAIAKTGNAAGTTANQLADAAAHVAEFAGSQHEAAEVLAKLTATGRVSGAVMAESALVAVRAQRDLGREVTVTISEFEALGKAPVDALRDLSEKYRHVTSATYAQVKALVDQGRAAEAAILAQQAHAEGIERQRQTVINGLSDWERGWWKIKTAVGSATDSVLDYVLNIGRQKTPQQEIASLLEQRTQLESNLTLAQQRGDTYLERRTQAALLANKAEINAARDRITAEKDKAAEQARTAAAEQLRIKIAGEASTLLSREEQRTRALAAARVEAQNLGLKEAETQQYLAIVRKKYSDVDEEAKRKREESDRKAQEVLERQANLLADLSGVNTDYMQKLSDLVQLRKLHNMSEERYVELVTALIAAQPGVKKAMEEQAKATKAIADAEKEASKWIAESAAGRTASGASLKLQYELYGKSTDAREIETAAAKAQAEAEKKIAAMRAEGKPLTDEVIQQLLAEGKARGDVERATIGQSKALEYASQLAAENKRFGLEYIVDGRARAAAQLEIDADTWRERIRLAGEGTKAQQLLQEEFNVWYKNQAAKTHLDDQKKLWSSIEQTAHDTFISIFDSGKSAFDRLKDTLKNGLYELLYQMTIKKWIVNIQANSSGAGALGSVGGAGGFSMANMGSLVSTVGGMFGSTSIGAFGQGMGMTPMAAARMGGGAYSAGASLGGASSALSVAGWIAAGMAAADALYNRGYNPNNGSTNTALTNPLIPGAMHNNKIFQALGINERWANMFSGASVVTALFGRKSPEVESQGIRGTFGGSGFTGEAYANILEKGGLFRSDKRYERTAAMSTEQDAAFDATFKGLMDAAKGFASVLGLEASVIEGYNKQIKLQLGEDEAKNQEAIARLFGEVGDELSLRLVPSLTEFKQAGETASATLQRLVTDYATVDEALRASGIEFGAVGVGSIAARERLVEAAGGLQAFAANAAGFQQNFLTETERNAPVLKAVREQLEALNLGWIDSREELKNYVVGYTDASGKVVAGLDLTTEAGARQYGSLMKLQAAFAQVYPAVEGVADTAVKAATALEQRKSLQEQLDTLTMTAVQLRAKERAKLDESNHALFDHINALQDAKVATEAASKAAKDQATSLLGSVDSAFSVLQQVVSREKSLIQDRINTQQAIIAKHRALADALHSTLGSMTAPGRALEVRQEAQAQIKTALAIAKAGGPLPDAEKLKNALATVGQDASALYATQQDYLRDYYTTQNDIAALASATDDALSVEEKALKALEEDGKRLDNILVTAQRQIDALKGIDTSVLSVEQAVQALGKAILSAQANPLVSVTKAIASTYQSALGRAPDAAGMQFWQDKAAQGVSQTDILNAIANSPEARLKDMYQATLGRPADASGLQFFMDQVNKGVSYAEVQRALEQSDEAKIKLRGFAVGTNQVPYDMPAMIHEDERIIPAADNRELMRRLASPEENSVVLGAAVERLTGENRQMRKDLNDALYAIAKNTMETKDILDKWETIGQPKTREA